MRLDVNIDRGNIVYIGGIVWRNREVLGSRAQDWVVLVSTRWGICNLLIGSWSWARFTSLVTRTVSDSVVVAQTGSSQLWFWCPSQSRHSRSSCWSLCRSSGEEICRSTECVRDLSIARRTSLSVVDMLMSDGVVSTANVPSVQICWSLTHPACCANTIVKADLVLKVASRGRNHGFLF